MDITMTIGQIFKSPQMLISTLSAAVAVLGTIGIITGVQSSSLQALLTAILGVLAAFVPGVAHVKLADRHAAEAVLRDRGSRTPPPISQI